MLCSCILKFLSGVGEREGSDIEITGFKLGYIMVINQDQVQLSIIEKFKRIKAETRQEFIFLSERSPKQGSTVIHYPDPLLDSTLHSPGPDLHLKVIRWLWELQLHYLYSRICNGEISKKDKHLLLKRFPEVPHNTS